MNPELSKFAYGVDDAAAAIGITRSHLYRAISNGELRSYRDGRRRMVSANALREYVAKREREAAASEPAEPARASA